MHAAYKQPKGATKKLVNIKHDWWYRDTVATGPGLRRRVLIQNKQQPSPYNGSAK
jgi:hypothetical protein